MKKITSIVIALLSFIIAFSQPYNESDKEVIENVFQSLKDNKTVDAEVLKTVDIDTLLDVIQSEIENNSSNEVFLSKILNIARNTDRLRDLDASQTTRIVDILISSLVENTCKKCNETLKLGSFNEYFLSTQSRNLLVAYIDKQTSYSSQLLHLIGTYNLCQYYDKLYAIVVENNVLEKEFPSFNSHGMKFASLLQTLAKMGNLECEKKYLENFDRLSISNKKGQMKSLTFINTKGSIEVLLKYLTIMLKLL